jgi:hypothetical protein
VAMMMFLAVTVPPTSTRPGRPYFTVWLSTNLALPGVGMARPDHRKHKCGHCVRQQNRGRHGSLRAPRRGGCQRPAARLGCHPDAPPARARAPAAVAPPLAPNSAPRPRQHGGSWLRRPRGEAEGGSAATRAAAAGRGAPARLPRAPAWRGAERELAGSGKCRVRGRMREKGPHR